MDLVDADTDLCAFDDLEFADAADCNDANELTVCDWDTPTTEVYHRGCTGPTPPAVCAENSELVGLGRPLIRADFAQGTRPIGAERYIVDSLDHDGGSCELSTDGTQLLPSSSGGLISVTTPVNEVGPCVCALPQGSILAGYTGPDAPEACDPGSDLGPPMDEATEFGTPLFAVHDGDGMVVRFGDAFGPASVRWSLVNNPMEEGNDDFAFDVAAYTHISVRIGNVVVGVEQGGINASDCVGDLALDEFVVSAEIEDADGQGVHSLELGTIVESDTRDVVGCFSSHFMQTIRVPIARYCAEGEFDPYQATAITLHFDDPDHSHIALVDSIELVRDPAGAALVPSCSEELDLCPSAAPSAWNCEATEYLIAEETSCSGEPIAGICNPGDIETTSVDLPLVDEGEPSEFSGWVVSIPRGWLRDPADPTMGEVENIMARCIAACELEFLDRPEIAANCTDSGAFETPTLRETNERGARVSIADARADGSGIFTGNALDCDLRDSCASAFDEDLAIARPRRPTSMSEPVGRGEEWFLELSGEVEADSSFAENPVSAGLVGTIGYSECAEGNDEGPCPFYLGSLELELVEPLTLALECGGPPEVHVIDELSVRLVQPAMGIAEEGTDRRGFPSGALALEADGVVDTEPFHALGPARRDFEFVAADGWAQMQGIGGAYVELSMPCGEGVVDVVAWLGFSAVGWPGERPSVTIEVDDEVTCPSTVMLEKTAADQENDIASVRWRVDGVLLDGAVTEIPFTEAHDLTAIVRDERGATYTKSKAVTCL